MKRIKLSPHSHFEITAVASFARLLVGAGRRGRHTNVKFLEMTLGTFFGNDCTTDIAYCSFVSNAFIQHVDWSQMEIIFMNIFNKPQKSVSYTHLLELITFFKLIQD